MTRWGRGERRDSLLGLSIWGEVGGRTMSSSIARGSAARHWLGVGEMDGSNRDAAREPAAGGMHHWQHDGRNNDDSWAALEPTAPAKHRSTNHLLLRRQLPVSSKSIHKYMYTYPSLHGSLHDSLHSSLHDSRRGTSLWIKVTRPSVAAALRATPLHILHRTYILQTALTGPAQPRTSSKAFGCLSALLSSSQDPDRV